MSELKYDPERALKILAGHDVELDEQNIIVGWLSERLDSEERRLSDIQFKRAAVYVRLVDDGVIVEGAPTELEALRARVAELEEANAELQKVVDAYDGGRVSLEEFEKRFSKIEPTYTCSCYDLKPKVTFVSCPVHGKQYYRESPIDSSTERIPDNIDAIVAEWHSDLNDADVPIYEYIGISWERYQTWAQYGY